MFSGAGGVLAVSEREAEQTGEFSLPSGVLIPFGIPPLGRRPSGQSVDESSGASAFSSVSNREIRESRPDFLGYFDAFAAVHMRTLVEVPSLLSAQELRRNITDASDDELSKPRSSNSVLKLNSAYTCFPY